MELMNQIPEAEDEEETQPREEPHVTVHLTNMMTWEDKGQIHFYIEGKTITALVDTGAKGNIIRGDLIPRAAIKPSSVGVEYAT